jgi:acetyltransferase
MHFEYTFRMMTDSAPNSDPQPGPRPYPAEYVREETLRDGSKVTIRPIRPEDGPELQRGFQQLSPESKYLRFLEVRKELSEAQALEFATVDYDKRMALVAEAEYEGEQRVVGVARYSKPEQDTRDLVETAIVVGDEFQGRGLGTLLMKNLALYAMDHGVKGFLATVHTSNMKIMNFIKKSGLDSHKSLLEPGTWEVSLLFPEREQK